MDRNPTPNPDDLLLLPEVAELTRRSEATLRWLRHRGEGPKGHRAGKRVYFRRGDVMEWLAEQERAASDPHTTAREPAPRYA